MRLLYSASVLIYVFAIRITSLVNRKAALWVKGRRGIFDKIKWFTDANSGSEIIWFHCASLGEFEQGRPLIEALKKQYPEKKIALSFFSPSGYEIRKNYPHADFVFYLPADTLSNAKKIIFILQPKAVLFIKYEFWFNLLFELKKQNIPTYLVSGIFRANQHFFKSYGKWFARQLNCFTYFFVQNKSSKELLKSIGYTNAIISGDTRFDRVSEIAANAQPIEIAKTFSANAKTIVAGSTWPTDEKIIAELFRHTENCKLIIAPHQIEENKLKSIESLFKNHRTIRFSQATESTMYDYSVLIIDNVGMLSSLYQFAYIAYVGGGFDGGIHNILEPAAHGCPVIFGPKHQKFAEAASLIDAGGAFEVDSQATLIKSASMLLNNPTIQKMASMCSKTFVNKHKGATQIILSHIEL